MKKGFLIILSITMIFTGYVYYSMCPETLVSGAYDAIDIHSITPEINNA